MISEREREILEIAKSINELALLFKDLQMMVIDQGTVLDRIDYNIEQTAVFTKDAAKELEVVSLACSRWQTRGNRDCWAKSIKSRNAKNLL